VRPDWVRLDGDIHGHVEAVRYRGPHTDLIVAVPGGRLVVGCPGPPRRRPGERVGLTITQTWPLSGMDNAACMPAPREKADTDA
jgi:TOBE domain